MPWPRPGRAARDPDLRLRYGERNEQVVRERLGDPGAALETLYLELLPVRPDGDRMRRILCLGLDGADHDLVCDLLAQDRLPTLASLAGRGALGPLRSTIPAVTPTAWSSFLTGLNPAGHGIFNFSTNPNRSPQRVESAASRARDPVLAPARGRRNPFGVRLDPVHVSRRRRSTASS